MRTENIIKRIETAVIYFLILVLPITVLSSFANVYETPKVALVLIGVLIVLFSKSIRALITNKISFSTSSFDIPVFLLALTYIASAVLESPNKMDAFFLPGTATIVVTGSLLYYLVNQLNSKEKSVAKLMIVISSVVYSLTTLLSVSGLFSAIPQLPQFVRSNTFNTLGSSLPGLIYLAVSAPLAVQAILKNEDIAKKAFYGVSAGLMSFAFLVNLFNVLPGRPTAPQLPSYATSWGVAIDAIQINPLLGMGPGNYLTAFTRFIPLEYNQSDIWSVRFTSGRSYAFTLSTEVGIAGIAAFAILLLSIYRVSREKRFEEPAVMALSISAILLVLFPSTSALLFIFFILLGLSSDSSHSRFDILNFEGKENSSRLPALVATVPVIALVFVISFYAQRVLSADITYKSALRELNQGDGGRAYETLQSAINKNTLVDRYRVSYAQLNLAIANNIASKEELSDQDRNTIATLIQQAIREGKNAVALNPTKASNWEVLGSIYRSVAPLAEGANAFAAQTYQQAIALDPLNPNTRIALGGIYYSVGQYENAIDTFELAVAVKADHANSYFNLAAAYREAGRIDEAIAAMSRVLSLVDDGTNDFEVASQVLEELQERKANAEIPSSDNLTAPEAQDSDLEPVLQGDEVEGPPEAPELEEEDSEADAAEGEDGETADESPDTPEEEPEPTETPLP